VVEFNGDGMMAVFGAPEPLASKEAAAVAAGREVVAGMPELPGARGELSAGVGIATGQAFVGNIQAVDRMIWTALGNTTNLASRLQQLTRDLGAAIVIDRRTFERAGDGATVFLPYVGAPIRGRNEREDLFLLPLRSAA
jgi:adenylate cyclase